MKVQCVQGGMKRTDGEPTTERRMKEIIHKSEDLQCLISNYYLGRSEGSISYLLPWELLLQRAQ